MAILELKNVSKEYQKGLCAVLNFNLAAENGDFVAIIGQIGSGKTTILKMIAGLERPTSGEIFIDGILSNKVKTKNRDVAMMFQNFQLFSNKTVRKNLKFGLKLRKLDKKEIAVRAFEAAKEMQIENILDKKPNEITQEERQITCLARVLVRKPRIFLLDEPLAVLNSKAKENVLNIIISLHRKLPIPFIYTTKNEDEIFAATKVILLN